MPSDVHPSALTADQRFQEIATIMGRAYLRLQCGRDELPLSDSGPNELEVRDERALMSPPVNEQRPVQRRKHGFGQ